MNEWIYETNDAQKHYHFHQCHHSYRKWLVHVINQIIVIHHYHIVPKMVRNTILTKNVKTAHVNDTFLYYCTWILALFSSFICRPFRFNFHLISHSAILHRRGNYLTKCVIYMDCVLSLRKKITSIHAKLKFWNTCCMPLCYIRLLPD